MPDLHTSLQNLPKITPKYAKTLSKLGLETVKDLLLYFPFRYDDFSQTAAISEDYIGQNITVTGKVAKTQLKKIFPRRMTVTEAILQDENNIPLKVVWFNQPFILESVKVNSSIRVSGKLTWDKKIFSMISPSWEKADRQATNTGRLVPVYSETPGITSKWLRWQIMPLLPLARKIPDFLPDDIRDKYNLFSLGKALSEMHFPTSDSNLDRAKKTLAFREIFLMQLQALKIKQEWEGKNSININFDEKLIKQFVDKLPFQLTNAQKKASYEILRDLEKPKPMNRLLNGDVGSGKTIVAAISALQVMSAGYQTAIMAPTEVLAYQHFLGLCKLLENYPINIGLLTNSYKNISQKKTDDYLEIGNRKFIENCKLKIENYDKYTIKTNRPKLIEQIKNGTINLIIGTHALIQKDVSFKNLALVVIDEQHRFGVSQRAALQQETISLTNTDLTQTHTETNFDLLYKDLTYKIRGAIFKVKKQLGLGHKESIYQKALAEEFKEINLFFEKEKIINIKYNNKKIGVYRPDFIAEHKLIIELKALPSIGKFEKQQVWHYLKGSDYKLALLVNFGRDDIEIERFIHTSPHESVSSPHKSVSVPHLLTMTATPIPRTLAIAFFGSLDLSILDEMPKNRKLIKTEVITPERREEIYDFIRQEISSGRQAFIVLPFVEESKAMSEVKAAIVEHERLSRDVFPDLRLGLLHGRLKAKEKEDVMREFKERELDILVSTPVVEVGIDVPNATVMIIENAERFGLAQLHQFRGRVGRGEHQSYCFLFTDAEKPSRRLQMLAKSNDGFKIAEYDLSLRGPGQFFGHVQSGIPDIAMEHLSNVKLIKFAREEAATIIKLDPQLKKHPLLKDALQKFSEKIHLE